MRKSEPTPPWRRQAGAAEGGVLGGARQVGREGVGSIQWVWWSPGDERVRCGHVTEVRLRRLGPISSESRRSGRVWKTQDEFKRVVGEST